MYLCHAAVWVLFPMGPVLHNRQAAMQERYRVSDESLTNLAAWLSEVETRIASLGALHEDVNRLAHQQAVAKVSLLRCAV